MARLFSRLFSRRPRVSNEARQAEEPTHPAALQVSGQSSAYPQDQEPEPEPEPNLQEETDGAPTGTTPRASEDNSNSSSSVAFSDVSLHGSEWESNDSSGFNVGGSDQESSEAEQGEEDEWERIRRVQGSPVGVDMEAFFQGLMVEGSYGWHCFHGIYVMNIVYGFFFMGGAWEGPLMKIIYTIIFLVLPAIWAFDMSGFTYDEAVVYLVDNFCVGLLSQVASDVFEDFKGRDMSWMPPADRWRLLSYPVAVMLCWYAMLAFVKFFWCRGRSTPFGPGIVWGVGTG